MSYKLITVLKKNILERGIILNNRMDIEDCAVDAKNLSVLAGTIYDALCYSPSTPDAHFASVALLGNLLRQESSAAEQARKRTHEWQRQA